MMMKTRSIIVSILLGTFFTGLISSCEKMFDQGSSITMGEKQRTWTPADTVYSVMGIIGEIQRVADRVVLLGELRGDLVSLQSNASEELKQIASFSVSAPTGADTDNPYNNPNDYFAIINNCNYYLAKADTTLKVNGKDIFNGEYGVVLGYRAWAYLQLAQVYGMVPFITTPIIDGNDADLNKYAKLDIREIAAKLIPELEKYVDIEHPKWGTVSESFDAENIFLPNQVILADLYLWAGRNQEDYVRAARLLHNFLNGFTESGNISRADYMYTGIDRVWWNNNEFLKYQDYSYASKRTFSPSAGNVISYIPMHRDEYDGVVSDLENIFCSTEKNKNAYVASISEGLKDICASYRFCVATYNRADGSIKADTLDPNTQKNKLEKGDLRVNYIFESSKETVEKQRQGYGSSIQKILKINPEIICLYRTDLLYLRLAEAYNRAGFHEMAFAILKYGLSVDTRALIPEEEWLMADAMGLGEWFYTGAYRLMDFERAASTSTINSNMNTTGIHDRGCGYSRYNVTYDIAHIDTAFTNHCEDEFELLAYTDSIEALQLEQVENYLIDELAMETCIEGNRFGDLIRFSMHKADDNGGYTDNAFLAERVARRNGVDQRDEALYVKLLGDGMSYNPAWYLPLPDNK